MKCPLCQSEMEAGGLYFNGNIWRKGTPGKSIWAYTWPGMKETNITIFAYRCPKDGKIELASKINI